MGFEIMHTKCLIRAVHENHSSGTKKNREWQEKLPLVVFKSEEIMYSKASSEAEYLDHETLWDRVNDAINTIIRKDESMETGEFLPPCVEAALNLGCVPVRTSRSQRNSNTRSYLAPRNQDPGPPRPKTKDTAPNARDIDLNALETRASLAAASSVFPLYYGLHVPPEAPRTESQGTHQNLSPIIVGTPVFQAVHEPLTSSAHKGCSETLFSLDRGESGPKKTNREGSFTECDLSLRLGSGKGSTQVKGVDFDLGQSSSHSRSQSKEFCFFPLNSEGEQVGNAAADVRKRKATDGGRGLLLLEPDFNRVDEWSKRRGL